MNRWVRDNERSQGSFSKVTWDLDGQESKNEGKTLRDFKKMQDWVGLAAGTLESLHPPEVPSVVSFQLMSHSIELLSPCYLERIRKTRQ